MTEEDGNQAVGVMATPSLVRPCLQKVAEQLTGRKYAKVQSDLESLLERLDSLMVSEEPRGEGEGGGAVGVSGQDVSVGGDTSGEESMQVSASESSIYGKYSELSVTQSEWSPLADGAAREIMLVLHDAMESRKPAVIDAALDCLQKLIAFSLIRGSVYSINHKRDVSSKSFQESSDGVQAPLQFAAQAPQAQAVELICSCDDLGDENVDLRLLKALLTVVTSSSLHVHSQALLFCVRAAYNVFLTSKSQVTQATAKATLIQISNVVFQRLETGNMAVVLPPIAVSDVLGVPGADNSKASSNTVASVQQFLTDVASAVDPFGTAAAHMQAELDEAFVPRLLSTGAASNPPESPIQTLSRPFEADVKRKPQEDLENAQKDASDGNTILEKEEKKKSDLQALLEKDGFLLLRALCKLSIRSPDSTNEQTTTKGKLLALELIKILLDNSGEEFKSRERIIAAIKQYLCLSLLKSCSSSSLAVQNLCSSIFTSLLMKFRASLKAEVGVFYPMIILKSIECPVGGMSMDSSTPTLAMAASDAVQKSVTLKCLEQVSMDGQLLVDLFVNYDCDIEGVNLFERTISGTVRLAQGGHASTGIEDLPEVRRMRFQALSFLTNALHSLSIWHKKTNKVEKATSEESSQGASDIDAMMDHSIVKVGGEVEEDIRSKWVAQLAAGQRSLPQQSATKQGDLVKIWKEFKKVFEQGIALFNEKPKKGIEFLQSQRLVGLTPEEVSCFLEATKGLDKSMIGDYLGERDDFNLKVMHAYVDALDFASLEFDAAIRKFLSGFRLPGEAQKIDRLMEKFAERFVRCNPDAFKSADVAYVLAYSVIMLNTDAHNPMVKNKMSKADFLRNNRGINDGGDLDQAFMESLYDRIIENEIKMDEGLEGSTDEGTAAPGGWFDSVMALLPGRQQFSSSEPADEAVRRTASKLRKLAEGASFFEAKDGDTIRPMVDVSWAPILGAFSVLFESEQDDSFIDACIEGFRVSITLVSGLEMYMLRSAFLSSLMQFTSLNAPSRISDKHVKAFRTLLLVAEEIGDTLGEHWLEVLRCVSRFELISSLGLGVPSDASLFASIPNTGRSGSEKAAQITHDQIKVEASSSIEDMHLQAFKKGDAERNHLKESSLPSAAALQAMSEEDLSRFYVASMKLNSESIVTFVQALCSVSTEELDDSGLPRVFSLTQIVEIAHFNMNRIRIVWGRIWADLSDFFVRVGCHSNLAISMYCVDSLRQLSMKFLTRDELANYNFQNDFLRPFVVLMRRSKNSEIRELIIRCVSQMVLARASNIKSGWKSVFMVFTCAATDKSPHVVRLAFNTVERIVREHFEHITETETTTFTDCVNCLVAFTNNPHSLDVSLNAIAFLRFCAGELAEGDIDLQSGELPQDVGITLNVDAHRIRPVGSRKSGTPTPEAAAAAATAIAVIAAATPEPNGSRNPMRFTDKDEHMYFWFPLLAGLSELTFDPRSEIRYGALGVLFDILKLHGNSFTREFWIRVYDSVLLPMFDHVRAEVTDTTTFSDEARRAEADAWLYETCTTSLQYLVDVVARYHRTIPELLSRSLDLVAGFVRRNHPSLAAVGVAALTQLAISCGTDENQETWDRILEEISSAAEDTAPDLPGLLAYRSEHKASSMDSNAVWSLSDGAGARRLSEINCKSGVQLLLAQACGEVYAAHSQYIPTDSAIQLLDILREIAMKSMRDDANEGLRESLSMAQAADHVGVSKRLKDPPFLHLEVESSQAYMSVLMSISAGSRTDLLEKAGIHQRICELCLQNLERFERQSAACQLAADKDGSDALAHENAALAPLAVATLKALLGLPKEVFVARVKEFYPILTNLIASDIAPPEVQSSLSMLFSERVSNMVE